MTAYPGGIYSPRTKANKSGVVYTPAKTTVGYAEDVSKLDDEVVAVETALGTDPEGSDTDVKTRIARNEVRTISFIIDGGGAEIAVGEHGHIHIPFKCTIVQAMLLADQSGDIKVDIWKDSYANFPPTNADTITGGEEPEITADDKAKDDALSAWTTLIEAGMVLAYNVDSVTTIERVLVCLVVETTA